jgi:hypothetical protein
MKSITTPPAGGAPGSAIDRVARDAFSATAGAAHATAHVNIATPTPTSCRVLCIPFTSDHGF